MKVFTVNISYTQEHYERIEIETKDGTTVEEIRKGLSEDGLQSIYEFPHKIITEDTGNAIDMRITRIVFKENK